MKKVSKKRHQRTTGEKLLIIGSVFAVLLASFALWSAIKSVVPKQDIAQDVPSSMGGKGRLSLTSFDKELGRKMMDKDSDGKCDSCGMPVDMCIDTGQLQCNMDSKSTIGVLDSTHIHADWKIYINGKALDLSDKAHMERMKMNAPVSSFIHVDSGNKSPEKTGDVLHMHATGVPLWIFFESLRMKFDKNCLVLETGEKFCSNEQKTLKFYVNGIPNEEWENYVFKDGEKILISYGSEQQQELQEQVDSITDFGKNH
ncbi:hypothetical protein HYS50_01225 [Candidatus Woesearchaeota archaeon]|nr:hypothetical protein [Candidatus Woesearchaeota archaeon]